MDLEWSAIEAAQSDDDGLDRLISLVWPAAYRIAFGILRDRGFAEDATQEACAAIARSLSQLKRNASFRTWAYRIVVNTAISIGRKRRIECNLDEAGAAIQGDSIEKLDLYRALGRLPLIQRAVVVMHYYAGFSSGEIASACAMPSSSVRFHLMLARRALKRALASHELLSSDLETKGVSHDS